MSIQKFVAPTSREALGKARNAFGDAAVILSNKSTAEGVEVIATTEDSLVTLDTKAALEKTALTNPGKPTPGLSHQSPTADADHLAMSTLSFQDYVRERMLRKRHEASTPASKPPVVHAPPVRTQPPQPPRLTPETPSVASLNLPTRGDKWAAPIAEELQAIKSLIAQGFTTLSWLNKAQQHPSQPQLMLKLLRAGFSPLLTRSLLEHLPADLDPEQSQDWITQALEQNIRSDTGTEPLEALGGVYAITGATGVGKTTTTAKIAAAAVQRHGPQEVGLITLDTYRMGAHDQLRAYGRAMGLVAHVAHDRAALQDLLQLLGNKKLVLIDTMGLAPSDPRSAELLELFDSPEIRTLVVLSASMHGDSTDDVLSSLTRARTAGVVLSKVDESAKLGPALDAVIRHHMVLRGVANGQRVPEDWIRADSAALVRQCLRASRQSAFDPQEDQLGLIFANTANTSQTGALYV